MPSGALLAIAAGVAVLVLVSSWSVAGWAYADWTAASATTREALAYAAPWAAGWSAWIAGRYLGSRSLVCPPSATRSGWPVVGRHLSWIVGAAVAGQVMGLTPLLAVTAVRATAGSFAIVVAAGSVAVLAALCVLGYLIGVLLPRWIGTLTAAIAAFGLILLADALGLAVAPLWLQTPTVGQFEVPVVGVFRVAFFTAAGVALAAAAARCVAERTATRLPRNYGGLILLVPVLALGGAARATAPEVVRTEADPPVSCAPAGAIEVCVHQAKEPLLDPFAHIVADVLGVVEDRPVVAAAVVVESSANRAPASGALTLDLQDHQPDWQDWAAVDLAALLSGIAACRQGADVYGTAVEDELDRQAVVIAFARWTVRSAGYSDAHLDGFGPPSARVDLDRLSPDEVRAAYHRFSDELARCDLPSSALPR